MDNTFCKQYGMWHVVCFGSHVFNTEKGLDFFFKTPSNEDTYVIIFLKCCTYIQSM